MNDENPDRAPQPPLVVGLTGGIASGKTAVSRRFATLGATVIDTDILAREVVAPGTAGLAAIRERFGDPVIDANGALDRRALRERIFSDPSARQDLEAITHPRIRGSVQAALAKTRAPYALVVVPLLIETGWGEWMDRILVVDAPDHQQRQRLMQRDGADPVEVDRILASQTTREERLARADDVIVNDGDTAALDEKVAMLHRQYQQAAMRG
jgi:dephospho-CoA kinase